MGSSLRQGFYSGILNHPSAPFKGFCASPEFQRTGVTAENSVEISAALFQLTPQSFAWKARKYGIVFVLRARDVVLIISDYVPMLRMGNF